jgi:hypothetical protein
MAVSSQAETWHLVCGTVSAIVVSERPSRGLGGTSLVTLSSSAGRDGSCTRLASAAEGSSVGSKAMSWHAHLLERVHEPALVGARAEQAQRQLASSSYRAA